MELELTDFLSDLFSKGEVTISPVLQPIKEEDVEHALSELHFFYDTDILNMPAQAPEFDEKAAMWAATYLYRTIQLILLRQLGEAEIQAYLPTFAGEISPSSVYSVDLTFRYLPNLFHLAKGLSPSDILVVYLNKLAATYPFSSVGIEIKESLNLAVILTHPSLKIAYIDRIIAAKDKKRIQQNHLATYVEEALGAYKKELWEGFE